MTASECEIKAELLAAAEEAYEVAFSLQGIPASAFEAADFPQRWRAVGKRLGEAIRAAKGK